MSNVATALVKFTMDMRNPWHPRVEQALLWQRMEPIDREKLIQQIQIHGGTDWQSLFDALDQYDIEEIVTQYIVLWAGLAVMPLLDLDKKKTTPSLADLFILVQGMSQHKWPAYTRDDWHKMQMLVRDSALEIDAYHVGVRPDWGV